MVSRRHHYHTSDNRYRSSTCHYHAMWRNLTFSSTQDHRYHKGILLMTLDLIISDFKHCILSTLVQRYESRSSNDYPNPTRKKHVQIQHIESWNSLYGAQISTLRADPLVLCIILAYLACCCCLLAKPPMAFAPTRLTAPLLAP